MAIDFNKIRGNIGLSSGDNGDSNYQPSSSGIDFQSIRTNFGLNIPKEQPRPQSVVFTQQSPNYQPQPTEVQRMLKPTSYKDVSLAGVMGKPEVPQSFTGMFNDVRESIANFGVQTLSSGLGSMAQGATGILSLTKTLPRRATKLLSGSLYNQPGINEIKSFDETVPWIKKTLDNYESAFDVAKQLQLVSPTKGTGEKVDLFTEAIPRGVGQVMGSIPGVTQLISKGQTELKSQFKPDFAKDQQFLQNYEQASTTDKITKYPLQTVRLMAPDVIGSGLAILGTTIVTGGTGTGTLLLSAATGEDVKSAAIQNGVSEQQAETLGIATAIPVMFLEKFGFDTILGKGVMANIGKSFGGQIAKSALTEAGTEATQEVWQALMENTFRDVSKDEYINRIAMAALGGALGGAVFGGTASVVKTLSGKYDQQSELNAEQRLDTLIQKSPKEKMLNKGLDYKPTENSVLKQSFVDQLVKDVRQQTDIITDEKNKARANKIIDRLATKEYATIRDFEMELARQLPKNIKPINFEQTAIGQEFNKAIMAADESTQQFMAERAFEKKGGGKRTPLAKTDITGIITGDVSAPPQNILEDYIKEYKQNNLLLPAPAKGVGEGFVMSDKADKTKVKTMKVINTYRNAVNTFNENPTVNNLKTVLKTREAYTSYLSSPVQAKNIIGDTINRLNEEADKIEEEAPKNPQAKQAVTKARQLTTQLQQAIPETSLIQETKATKLDEDTNKTIALEQQENMVLLDKESINKKIKKISKSDVKKIKNSVKDVQNDLVNLIKTNLPTKERGQFVSLIKNTQTANDLEKATERVFKVIEDFKEANTLLKQQGQAKSKIAWIKKQYELNQTVANEIKKEVGITSWQNATPEQLNKMIVLLKKRALFKTKQGFKLVDADTKEVKIDPKIYDNATPEKTGILPTKVGTVKTIKSITDEVDKFIGLISTRIKNISPEILAVLRRREFDTLSKTNQRINTVLPFIKLAKKVKGKDRAILKLAMLNGDTEKTTELFKKYNLKEQAQKSREVLDTIHKEGNDVGMDFGYKKEYWTRQINDPKGLVEYFYGTEERPLIEQSYKEFRLKYGREPEIDEKADIINKMIRGYQGAGGITLSIPGAAKKRVIDVIDNDIVKFYDDPIEALPGYIEVMTDQIETRKLFGKHKIGEGGLLNLDHTIGGYVTDLLARGKIKPGQDTELSSILKARFGKYGNEWRILSVFKDVTYASLLGNPVNAIGQLPDLAFSLYEAPVETIPSFLKTLIRANKLKKEDIGVTDIAKEFSNKTKLGKFVKLTFKTGFDFMDRIGKETLINATFSKFSKQAKNGSDDLLVRLMDTFGNNEELAHSTMLDLKQGNITEDVKFVLFNELSKKQPITQLELPEKYLTNPNGRIFYMMKTYTLKQIDVYRNEVYNEMKTNPKQGMINFVKLTAALVALGVTADELKDYIQGKDVKLRDNVINNLIKLLGFSRYTFEGIKTKGLGKAILEDVLIPPTNIVDDFATDLYNQFSDPIKAGKISELKSIKNIPIGGKLYYYWFGKGAEYNQQDAENKIPQKLFDDMKSADTVQEKKQILNDVIKSGEFDDKTASKLVSLIKDDVSGITEMEKKIRSANNEDRASYIIRQLKGFDTPEERKNYLLDLQKKGILNENVLIEMSKQKTNQ